MKKINLFTIILLLCFLTSCGKQEQSTKKTVLAMDTAITLTAYGNNAEKAIAESEKEIQRIDTEMSRSNQDGEIYSLNKNKKERLSDESMFVINTAIDICKSTNGAFDITVSPLMDLWGFFGHEYRVPTETEISEQLKKVDYKNIVADNNTVILNNDSCIDLGGIAKGYASDKVTEIFKENKIKSGLISFGSAIQAVGTKPDGSKWRIGITDPQNTDGHIARLEVADKCVVTSGSYEQVFEENGQKYHHIINPSTGYPADNELASVSIISDSATTADGLSTGLFVMGLDKAIDYWKTHNDFDVIFVTTDNKVYCTEEIDKSLEMLSDTEYNVIHKK